MVDASPERARVWLPLPAGHVVRDRITSAILTSPARVVLLVAGAGYGKSVALREFEHVSDSPVAMVGSLLGRTDRQRFWMAVTESIGSVVEGSLQALNAGLLDGEQADIDFVQALLDELEHVRPVSSSITIAVDDYHLVQDQAVHDLVELFVERLPHGIRLVLSTRLEPALPVAKWVMQGWATVLRPEDLVFDRDEVGAVLHNVAHFDIAPETLDLVYERTEGWPAGVQVAALAIQTGRDETSIVGSLTGTNRTIAQFFSDEVLVVLPEADREFLLETSILDVLTPALCRAVTGRNDSGRVLEDLERRGVFTTRVDPGGTEYQYHHLFAETLRHRLASIDQQKFCAAHRRAADHLLSEQQYVAALDHLIDAMEPERAYRLMLERHLEIVPALPSDGLARFLDRLPSAITSEDRSRTIDLAFLIATCARLRDAIGLLGTLDQHPDPGAQPTRAFWLDIMLAAVLGDMERLRTGWASRFRVAPPDPALAPYWREIPITFEIADDHAAADAAWQMAIDGRFNSFAVRSVHLIATAFGAAWSGRMTEAARAVDAGMAAFDRQLGPTQVHNSRLFHAAALVAMENDRLDDAGQLLDDAVAIASLMDETSSFVVVLQATMIELLRRTGAPDAGLRRADNVLYTGVGEHALSPLFRSVVSEMALRCAIDAADLIRAGELMPHLSEGIPRSLGLARLHLARRDLAAAGNELTALDLGELERRAPRRALDALMLCSVAEPSRRVAALEAATRIADRYGLYGSLHFGDSFAVDGDAARADPVRGPSSGRAAATLRALEVAPLSDRESDVLSLLPTEMSNADVADELMISVHTVKSHIKAIYRKLQASGRSDAVRIAREVGLLAPRPATHRLESMHGQPVPR